LLTKEELVKKAKDFVQLASEHLWICPECCDDNPFITDHSEKDCLSVLKRKERKKNNWLPSVC
jgi:hypothetical protein